MIKWIKGRHSFLISILLVPTFGMSDFNINVLSCVNVNSCVSQPNCSFVSSCRETFRTCQIDLDIRYLGCLINCETSSLNFKKSLDLTVTNRYESEQKNSPWSLKICWAIVTHTVASHYLPTVNLAIKPTLLFPFQLIRNTRSFAKTKATVPEMACAWSSQAMVCSTAGKLARWFNFLFAVN